MLSVRLIGDLDQEYRSVFVNLSCMMSNPPDVNDSLSITTCCSSHTRAGHVSYAITFIAVAFRSTQLTAQVCNGIILDHLPWVSRTPGLCVTANAVLPCSAMSRDAHAASCRSVSVKVVGGTVSDSRAIGLFGDKPSLTDSE